MASVPSIAKPFFVALLGDLDRAEVRRDVREGVGDPEGDEEQQDTPARRPSSGR
jgi:hypothetical protein